MNENIKLTGVEMNRISTEEFHQAEKIPVMIVLDNVRSLNNVGSVFRSSDAFRIEKIWLCGITGTPPDREIHKTALGAEESIEWEYCKDSVELIKKLKADGIRLFAAEQTVNSIALQNFQIDSNQHYAVIFGNEVKGVQQEIINECDGCIEIPQFGTKHSFNISVSVGIVLWQIVRPLLSKFL